MTKFRSRTLARQRAFQVLYSLEFTGVRTIEDLRTAFDRFPEESSETDPGEAAEYAWALTAGVWANVDKLDADISAHTKNWRIERLGKVELTVLRLAFHELEHYDDVPEKVVISEALDLASRFSGAQARHFVNGVLDAAITEQN